MKYLYKKKRLLLIGSVAALHNCACLAFPFALMWITDSITSGNYGKFSAYVVFAVTSVTIQIALHILLEKSVRKYTAFCMTSLKSGLIKAILSFKYGFFAESDRAEYNSFLINDIKMLEDKYYGQIIGIVKQSSLLLFACVSIFLLKPIFLAVVLAVYVLSVMIPLAFKRKIVSANRELVEANQVCTKAYDEILSGFSLIKAHNLKEIMYKLHMPSIKTANDKNAKLGFWLSAANATLAFMSILLTLSVFVIGGRLVMSGLLTVGALVALAQLLVYAIDPIIGIIGAKNSINSVRSVIGNCDQIMGYKEEVSVGIGEEAAELTGVALNKVSFGYSGGKNGENKVISDLTYEFAAGKKYALVGHNGSGKSTLLKILAGFYDSYEGDICLGGISYRRIPQELLSSKIAYMEQDSFLFDLPILDNITLLKDYDDTQVDEAVAKAGLDGLVCVRSGESASTLKLSGGEKQRVSMARGMLTIKGAEIILADEPAAALDKSGSLKFDEMIRSVENKLCIVVTHKLDKTLEMYDTVLVMDDGKIVESGPYKQLVSDGKYFSEMKEIRLAS